MKQNETGEILSFPIIELLKKVQIMIQKNQVSFMITWLLIEIENEMN